MKKRNSIFGLLLCATLLFSLGTISKITSANAGYAIAKCYTKNDVIHVGVSTAGATAGWLGACWAGAKIGGKIGACVGGPVGIICGSALGAM